MGYLHGVRRTIILVVLAILAVLLLAGATCSNGEEIAKVDGPIRGSVVKLGYLSVPLTPTDAAQSNKTYEVDLYEEGKLRDTSTVRWSAPELNVKEKKYVFFPLSREESDAYTSLYRDLSDIFSVKVHE